MGPTEFKYRFSILFNNIMSDAAPGMNDYEISYYLTKGQLELIKERINPKGNKYMEGVDGSAKRQADLGTLICIERLCRTSDCCYKKFDIRSIVYDFPKSYIAILNENLTVTTENQEVVMRQVCPISFEEYTRLMLQPYKEPLKNQVWRLQSKHGNVEIITTTEDRDKVENYTIRYVKYPTPIIVSDLYDIEPSLEIDGYSEAMTSKLNEELHEEIVQRAVELAKASYASDQSGQAQLQNQITVGQRSE